MQEIRQSLSRRPVSRRPVAATVLSVVIGATIGAAAHAQMSVTTYTGIGLTQTHALLGFNYGPPDTMGAVGNNDFVEFINGGYQVFNKSNGTARTALETDTAFWENAGISAAITNSGLSDTRIIFDKASQRWFASEINTQNTGNSVLVARSDSADPAGIWKATSFVSGTQFADYPTLSLDSIGVYIGANNFTSGGADSGTSLFSIPKSDLLLSTPTVANRSTFNDDTSYAHGFTLQGVLDTSGGSLGTGAILAVSNTSMTLLNKFNVQNPGATGATLSPVITLAVQNDNKNPNNFSLQPDGTAQLDASDNRLSSQVVRSGNYVYLAHSIDVNGRNVIRVTILNATATAVLAESTISGGSTLDYSYPSISANANGDLLVGFSRSGSGAGQFIGGYARLGRFNGTSLTFSDSDITLAPGQANYHLFNENGERWGDYSATMIDPTDPNTFWTIQESAGTGNNWTTNFSRVSIATAVPEPSGLLLLGVGAVAGVGAVRRRRSRSLTGS